LSLVCRKWHRPAVAAFWYKYELISDSQIGMRGVIPPRAPGQHPLRRFDRAFLEGPALERCAPLVRHLVCSALGPYDSRVADAIVALRHLCKEVRTVRLSGGTAFDNFFVKSVHAPSLVHLSDVSGSVSPVIGWPVEVFRCLDGMAVAAPSLTSLAVTNFGRAASWAAQPRCGSPLPLMRLRKLRSIAHASTVPPDAVARLFASVDLAYLEDLSCAIGVDFQVFADILPHCKRLLRLEVGCAASSLFARSSGGDGGFLGALSAPSALEHVGIRSRPTSVDYVDPSYKLNAAQVAQVLAALPVNIKEAKLVLDFFPKDRATLVALDDFIAQRSGSALEAFEWAEVGLGGTSSTLRWELCDGKLVRVSDS